jgi:hypothetical protein
MMNKMRMVALSLAGACFVAAAAPAGARYYNSTGNYANPDGTMTQQARGRVCSDPWVTLALESVYGSADPAKCSIDLYNRGQWRDYNELVHAVEATRLAFLKAGLDLKLGFDTAAKKPIVVLVDGSNRVIGNDSGSLIEKSVAKVIGNDSGSLISNSPGVISPNGGLFNVNAAQLPKFTITTNFSLLSGAQRSIRLPAGNVIVVRR